MLNQPVSQEESQALSCSGSSAIDALISMVYDLKHQVTELEDTVAEQQETIDDQQRTIDEFGTESSEQQQTIEELQDWTDTLETKLADYRAANERDKALIKQDSTEAVDRSDANLDDIIDIENEFSELRAELRRVNGGRSSLEQVVMLPDEIAHRADLSKNQLRARDVASDIKRLAKNVPAGSIVHSSSIKSKLKDLFNKGHDNTVARVMDFINDFAGEQCEIIHRNGRKSLVLDDELVEQLDRAEQFAVDNVDAVLTDGVRITTTAS